ncbi:hypothetical protein Tco_1070357, partial [Tanacetum coccineum]
MDIMNRLLVKSLLSKQWKFSIDSFDFIHNYGCRETNTCCFNLSFMHNLQGYIHSFDENLAFRNFDSNLDLFSLKPVASSEGICCFSFSENSFLVLWNPSMKKSVAISVPNYIQQPDSLKMIFGFGICPVTLELTRIKNTFSGDFQDGFISSCSLLFNIPHPAGHFLKLLGFSNDNQPIVEAEIVQQWYRSLQVFHPIIDGFVNIGVEANHYIAMVKMAPYEAFACRCGKGDVVLRESYQPNTRGKLYYACPQSKEFSLDIDDSDLQLTDSDLQLTPIEPSRLTPNPVTIIPGHAGIVQLSSNTRVEPSSSTSNTVRIIPGPAGLKVVDDVGEDVDFNSVAWVSATNYVNAFGGTVTGCLGDIDNFLKKGKLEQVVAIVKSCAPNVLGDLNVTLKDLSGIVPGTINYKVLDVGSYGKDITVGAAMILANVSVFTPKPSKHYLNITKRNVVEVF